MADLIGQSLGRYHILEQLGEGGMAVVYKAFDTRLERNVAVKIILPGKERSEKFLKRFEREAKALASLSHPNIVKVIDYGEHEGLPYLVMEHIPGGTLKRKLSGKPLPWLEATRLLIPIARALNYAHEQKIIHRDVKPSNILITQSGEPMLSDFGIAKILEVEETLDLTGTGVGVGTPEYMSPEQAQGKGVDARSDIYSLGVVLYEMLTGRKPYQADTPMAVVWKLASEPLPRPKQIVKDLPDAVEQVLLKALARMPEDRFPQAIAFASAMEKLESGGLPLRQVRPSINKQYLKIASSLLGLVLFAVAAVYFAPSIWSKIKPQIEQAGTAAPDHSDRTYLVLEDFEDEQVQMYGFSAQQGWEIVEDETGNAVFQLDNRDSPDYLGFSFGGAEWNDYVTEYRVRYLNDIGSIGLQVRSDGSKYYVTDLNLGELYLAHATPSEWVRITTKFPPVQINTWHTVRVAVEGDSIEVFIDDARWIDEQDSKYKNGEAMLFASPGTYAQVDDIKVWQAGNGQATSGGEILLDQSHEGLSVDLATAATLEPNNPEYVYIGPFYKGISEKYQVSLHENNPINEASLSNFKVLILASPDGLYFEQEVNTILDFVERGGGLLILKVGGGGNLDEILTPLGVKFTGRLLASPEHLDWGPWGFVVVVNSTDPILKGVDAVTVNAGRSVEVDNPDDVILWTDSTTWLDANENQKQDAQELTGEYPVIVRLTYGQGKVVILPAVEVWSGFYNDNEKVFLNALNWLLDTEKPVSQNN